MNKVQKVKLYTVSAVLGFGLAMNVTKTPIITQVEAMKTDATVTISESITPSPSLTPTTTPTPTPVSYNHNRLKSYYIGRYGEDSLRDSYIDYVWQKWSSHGNAWQATAICTNFSEGHFTDKVTNDNGSEGIDRGCWMWNSKYHPEIPDEVAFDCKQSTDLTYDKWLARGMSFANYWYGYGSDNYYLCLSILTN